MKLKQYQTDTLAILRRFLEEARFAGPKNAYDAVTTEPEQAKRLRRYRTDYRALDGLPAAPYVCLRLPTGGGKTILAAHAIGVARDAWVEKDYPLVLWLVPSNTIRLQTVEALRNTRHPYRQALDEQFEGRVRVFDIADFTTIRPQDIRDNACTVVGTIQTLRVNNTEGRKVYAHNENGSDGQPAVLIRQSSACPTAVDDRGRGPQCRHRSDPRHAGARQSLRDRRVHRDPAPQLEHFAQRHSAGTEGGGDDQAADHPGRTR
jgi:hypothetical protein